MASQGDTLVCFLASELELARACGSLPECPLAFEALKRFRERPWEIESRTILAMLSESCLVSVRYELLLLTRTMNPYVRDNSDSGPGGPWQSSLGTRIARWCLSEGAATSARPLAFAQCLLEEALDLVDCAVQIHEDGRVIYQNKVAAELEATRQPHMVLREHSLAVSAAADGASRDCAEEIRVCTIVTKAVPGVANPIARRTLDAVPQPVWATTPDGKACYCNPATEQLVGCSCEDFVNREWVTLVHPDDRERVAAAFATSCADGSNYEVEERLQVKELGQYHNFLIKGGPLLDDLGRVLQWVGVATDIQGINDLEQELADERALFLTALDQLPLSLIIAVAPCGKIRLCNKKAAQLWGRELFKIDEGGGLPGCLQEYERWSALHPSTGNAYTAAEWPLARSIAHGEVVTNEEANFTRVDGTVGIVRMSSAPVRNSDGGITAGLLICEDITQHRRLQEEQARMQVVEAAAEQSRALVSNVSHELRTPLNGIIGVSSLLAESDLSEEQAEYVQVIHESSKLLLTVIGDILDFSRIEAGMLDLEAIPFSPAAVVQHVMALMAQIAAEKGVDIQLRVADDVPPCVIGDPERLKQCLFNLCSNAVKFTPANGSVTLTCEARPDAIIATGAGGTSGAGQDTLSRAVAAGSSLSRVCLRFSVRDTGLGMSAEGMARCFKPFAQADVSTTRRFGGTGLGLAITRQLVTLMGGEVGVESEEGRGSTFTFTVRLGACTTAQAATGGALPGEGEEIGPAVFGAPPLASASGFASTLCAGHSPQRPVVLSDVPAKPAVGASSHAPASSLETIPAFAVSEERSVVFQPPASCSSPALSVRGGAGCAQPCSRPSPHFAPATAIHHHSEDTTHVRGVVLAPGHPDVVVPIVSGVASAAAAHDIDTRTRILQTHGRPASGLAGDCSFGGDASPKASVFAALPDHANAGPVSCTYPTTLSPGPGVKPPSSSLTQQPIRILLAEDNAVNSLIATRYLRNLGYSDVVAVADGQAAVAAVSDSTFHLVLMDCQMPVMDGYEATRRIRTLPDPAKRATPIVALTASALQDDVNRCMAAGMNDHLSKPYLAHDLALKLNFLLPPSARCSVPPAGLLRSRSHTSSSSSSSSSAFEVAAAPHSAEVVADLPRETSSAGTTITSRSIARL